MCIDAAGTTFKVVSRVKEQFRHQLAVTGYASSRLFLVSVLYVHPWSLRSHECKIMVLVLAISSLLTLPELYIARLAWGHSFTGGFARVILDPVRDKVEKVDKVDPASATKETPSPPDSTSGLSSDTALSKSSQVTNHQ
jgi:hypothetical protein